MFEVDQIPGLVRSGLLGTAVSIGLGAGMTSAKAESSSAVLPIFLHGGALHAQGAPIGQGQANSGGSPQADDVGAEADRDVPFSELNAALQAAQARLAELNKAAEIAKVAGKLRENLESTQAENQQLKAALAQLQAEYGALQKTEQEIRLRAQEAEKSFSEKTSEAERLDEELTTLRWQNGQLSTSLAEAETLARDTAAELNSVKTDFETRLQGVSAEAQGRASEIEELRNELDATRQSALIAEQRGTELEEQLAESRLQTSQAEAEAEKLGKDLDVTISELGTARSELTATQETIEEFDLALGTASQEKAVLREQFAATRDESDQLREKLAAAEERLEEVTANNAGLRQQVAVLQTAAGEATDAARLNLIAVENQINEINAALASVKGDEAQRDAVEVEAGGTITASRAIPPGSQASPAADAPSPQAAFEQISDNAQNRVAAAARNDLWVPDVTPPRASVIGEPQEQQQEPQQRLIAAAASSLSTLRQASTSNPPPAARSPLAGGRVASPQPDTPEASTGQGVNGSATRLLADLPDDRRARAESLLTGLSATSDDRGLTMTVPGAILFAVNSQTIEPEAYDTLAKVAEMVDIYGDREVLIVGHTDAVGNDGYNQQLSETRADLVRDYFINNFGIAGARLSSEGLGERRPISSNATAEGRDANRRIEVILLN